MAIDFTEVLSKKGEELTKPPVRPAGTYLMAVAGPPEQKKVTPKQGEFEGQECPVLAYKFKFLSASDDVDQTALAEHPPVASWGTFGRSHDFWLQSEAGQYRHSEFLTHVLGQGPEVGTVGERIAQAMGAQVLVTFKHQPYTDRQTGNQEIGLEISGIAHP